MCKNGDLGPKYLKNENLDKTTETWGTDILEVWKYGRSK